MPQVAKQTLALLVAVMILMCMPKVNAGTFKIDGLFEGCQIGKLYPLQKRGILECREEYDAYQFDPVVESEDQEVNTIGGNRIDALIHDGIVVKTSINDQFEGCELGKEIEFVNQMVFVCSEYKSNRVSQPKVLIYLFTNRTPHIIIDKQRFSGELYYSRNHVKPQSKTVNQSTDYLKNLELCLEGKHRSLCRHDILTADDAVRVVEAEYRSNLELCLEGKYRSLCRHDILTADDAVRVAEAEYRSNLELCLEGKYRSLCRHDILTADDVVRVVEAEYRSNLELCLEGKYRSLCRHDILTADDVVRVVEAEYRSNLELCLEGKYRSLCRHDILTADDAVRVAEAEYRSNLELCLEGKYRSLCNYSMLTPVDAKRVK